MQCGCRFSFSVMNRSLTPTVLNNYYMQNGGKYFIFKHLPVTTKLFAVAFTEYMTLCRFL